MIDINNKTTAIYSILKDIKKTNIILNYRFSVVKEFGNQQKRASFIDSILRNYPIIQH